MVIRIRGRSSTLSCAKLEDINPDSPLVIRCRYGNQSSALRQLSEVVSALYTTYFIIFSSYNEVSVDPEGSERN